MGVFYFLGSDTNKSMVSSKSNLGSSYLPEKAFNGSQLDRFITASGVYGSDGLPTGDPEWIQWDLGSGNSKALVTARFCAYLLNTSPKVITVYGSDTGAFSGEETNLGSATISDKPDSGSYGEWAGFNTSNLSFRYFRFTIDEVHYYSVTRCEISEAQLGEYLSSENVNRWSLLTSDTRLYIISGTNNELATKTANSTASRVVGRFGRDIGKWYFEVEFDPAASSHGSTCIGLCCGASANNAFPGDNSGSWGYSSNRFYDEGSDYGYSYLSIPATIITYGILVDIDAGKAWWVYAGTIYGYDGSSRVTCSLADVEAGTNPAWSSANMVGETLYPTANVYVGDQTATLLLTADEQSAFTLPAGYEAWGDGAAASDNDLSTWLEQPYSLFGNFLSASLEQPYTLAAALSANLEQPYSFLLQAYLAQHYGDARACRAWLIQRYGNVPVLRAWLEQPYEDPLQLAAWLEQPWRMPDSLRAHLAQHYGIAAGKLDTFLEQLYILHEHPQLASHLLQPYLIGDLERTTHEFDYSVWLAGVAVDPHIVNWDFRQSRYYGTIEMTFKLQSEALLAVDGAPVVFSFGGTTYYFRVDGDNDDKGGWRETSSFGQVSYSVTAHSAVRWLGAPWATPLNGPIDDALASTMFAAICAPYGITVDYQITDDFLSGIIAEDETPIDLIRRLLPDEAVLQSGPGGDVLYIRWDEEVPVPLWRTVTPAVTIDDLTGFMQTSETSDKQKGHNLIDVTDQQTAEDQSNLVSEVIDGRTMECRMYLSPWDEDIEFVLIHTAGEHVTIEPFGPVTRDESEVVEIVDGAGRTRHPIDDVLATDWQEEDLGEVTADDDGIIDAQHKRTWDATHETYTGGDSLLAITYRTRFWRWLVRSPRIEQVQVVALRVVDEGVLP